MMDDVTGKLVPWTGNMEETYNNLLGVVLKDTHAEAEVMNMKEDDKPYNDNDNWIDEQEDEYEDDDIDWGDDDDDDDDYEEEYLDDEPGDDIDWDEDDDENLDVGF